MATLNSQIPPKSSLQNHLRSTPISPSSPYFPIGKVPDFRKTNESSKPNLMHHPPHGQIHPRGCKFVQGLSYPKFLQSLDRNRDGILQEESLVCRFLKEGRLHHVGHAFQFQKPKFTIFLSYVLCDFEVSFHKNKSASSFWVNQQFSSL